MCLTPLLESSLQDRLLNTDFDGAGGRRVGGSVLSRAVGGPRMGTETWPCHRVEEHGRAMRCILNCNN